jgi:photosystem II stability/assembly factor-like uncharacterized protein
MSKHRLGIQVAACIVTTVMAVAASGCGSQRARSDGGTASGSEHAASPSGGTPSSSARTPAAQPVRSTAGIWLQSLQMVSATTGWALLSTSNPDNDSALKLGRTTDGGRTWALVTPPAPAAALADGVVLLKALTARQAWLVTAAPSSAGGKTLVFSTLDSGRSWRPSAPIAANQPVAIDIIGRRGWLLESLGAAMGHNPVQVYRTTDSGRRWSLAAQSGTGQAAARGLVAACDKVGMAFSLAPRLGWITSQCNVGYSLLVSRDGGTGWASQDLPVPQSTCLQAGCVAWPLLVAADATILELQDYPDQAVLLVSHDAGLSWRILELPAAAKPYPRIQFFGPLHAIAVSAGTQGSVGSTFYVTSDGGLSWTAVPQGRHFGRDGASFDFVSPTTGIAWLLPGIDAASPAPKVYRTLDSGRSWASFVPRLA